MVALKLTRPLACFDIEATGISPTSDRIIELAISRLHPDGTRDSQIFVVNPGIAIPADSTAIHGFTNEDVADKPSFADVADDVIACFEDCDLAGFNVIRFDIPMLIEECVRAKKNFSMEGRRVADAQRIFHRKEPRDLTAALAFYCNEMHIDAHGAAADVEATLRVLEAQVERYADVPADIEALDAYCSLQDPAFVDRSGRLKWVDGEVTINFGKNKRTTLRSLIAKDKGFIKWLLRSDFPSDVKQIVQDACNGQWPAPPSAEKNNKG